MAMGKRLRGSVIVWILFIAAASWWGSSWYKKHQQEAKREAASKAQTAADTEKAKSELARLRVKWNADVSWEHRVFPPDSFAPAYSLDIQEALVKSQPIIVIGEIQDVQS